MWQEMVSSNYAICVRQLLNFVVMVVLWKNSKLWDMKFSELCHNVFKVFFQGYGHQYPWIGHILASELKDVLKIKCDICLHCFMDILGPSAMNPSSPQVILLSHILSYFFTFISNLLQDCTTMEIIVDKIGPERLFGMERI